MRVAPLLAFGLGIMASPASSPAQHRELGAHEHGRGMLNVAVEGNRVSMELEAPAADIVGFEHAARTRQQRAAVEKAKQQLLAPLALFKLPSTAGCTVGAASVELESGGHDDTKKGGHEDAHSEFHAQYTFDCQAPASLTSIEFDYFRTFPSAQRLNVNVITPKGQTKFEASRGKPRIDLAGMM
jgi:hypothetical protein